MFPAPFKMKMDPWIMLKALILLGSLHTKNCEFNKPDIFCVTHRLDAIVYSCILTNLIEIQRKITWKICSMIIIEQYLII